MGAVPHLLVVRSRFWMRLVHISTICGLFNHHQSIVSCTAPMVLATHWSPCSHKVGATTDCRRGGVLQGPQYKQDCATAVSLPPIGLIEVL